MLAVVQELAYRMLDAPFRAELHHRAGRCETGTRRAHLRGAGRSVWAANGRGDPRGCAESPSPRRLCTGGAESASIEADPATDVCSGGVFERNPNGFFRGLYYRDGLTPGPTNGDRDVAAATSYLTTFSPERRRHDAVQRRRADRLSRIGAAWDPTDLEWCLTVG